MQTTTHQAEHGPARGPGTAGRPDCPICGRRGVRRHGPLTDRAHAIPGVYFISSCLSCRVGWLDPRPIDQDIGLAYPGDYYTHDENATNLEIAWHEGAGLKASLRRLILNERYGYDFPAPEFIGHRQIGRWLGRMAPLRYRLAYRRDEAIPRWKSPGRLLDIGCGAGHFLRYARSLGWTPFGLEPDPIAADVARRHAGAEVVVGTLDTVELPAASFDAVVSMHSIEHTGSNERTAPPVRVLRRNGNIGFRRQLQRRLGAWRRPSATIADNNLNSLSIDELWQPLDRRGNRTWHRRCQPAVIDETRAFPAWIPAANGEMSAVKAEKSAVNPATRGL